MSLILETVALQLTDFFNALSSKTIIREWVVGYFIICYISNFFQVEQNYGAPVLQQKLDY